MNNSNEFQRNLFDEEHEAVRANFRRFLEKEVVPYYEGWEKEGIIPHEVYEMVGEQGYLCMAVPEKFGGMGINDFRYNVVLHEEATELGLTSFAMGISLINDVALPYFIELTNDEQKQRWLPDMCRGKLMTAIAMTEPGAGSDLANLKTRAVENDGHFIVNGSKTFITNGINADLIMTAVRTNDENGAGGISMMVLEEGMEGFDRGRNLEKIGIHGQDTAELFFNNVKVPSSNLVGVRDKGFRHMMINLPQERLGIAVSAFVAARTALNWTLNYVRDRKAFGRPVGTFQNSRFAIAEMRTQIEISQIFIDECIQLHLKGELSAEKAAMAKWWCTDLQGKIIDQCLQLHGGYGYMTEFPIARAWMDARITRIFGGTNEIMKEIIGRAEGLG